MITVTAAPPFATIQDLGRPGYRDSGVPISGIADRDSGIALNLLLGNDPNAAMIEWALGGGALVFNRAATVAIGGADAICTVNGLPVSALAPFEVLAGSEFHVGQIVRGRFLLVAVRGGIDVPVVLGSRSTLLSAAVGGLEGRRLRTGDALAIGDLTTTTVGRTVTLPMPKVAGNAIQVMRGPQASLFDAVAWETFLTTEFTVARASDRTGYRLEGSTMSHSGHAALPSEPTCVGAIQVPDGAAPIVIMQDGPTVGGYPKIAVIRSGCLSRFAQLVAGDRLTFVVD